MTLKDTLCRLCTVGSEKNLELIHKPTGEILQTLQVRSPTESHRSFIISTWLKSYRPQAKRQGILTEYDLYEPAIAESRWQDCTVATDEDGFTVYAWCCGYAGALYHCYVVPELRGIGAARSLIQDACGDRPAMARPWPFRHKLINPYLLKAKDGPRQADREDHSY